MHNYSDFLTMSQLSAEEFAYLLSSAAVQRDRVHQPLAGKNIALIFEKPSLRTRVTFEVAIRQLGAWPILLGSKESQLGERETIADLARNLSLWVDGIVARVFRHVDLEELATFASIPVVNALSDWEHPCQALADILTLTDVWSDFDGKKVVYVGDWNNVSRSLWKACELAGFCFPRHLSEGIRPCRRREGGVVHGDPTPWKAPMRSTPTCGPAWVRKTSWKSASRFSGPIRSTSIDGEDRQADLLHALPARSSRA